MAFLLWQDFHFSWAGSWRSTSVFSAFLLEHYNSSPLGLLRPVSREKRKKPFSVPLSRTTISSVTFITPASLWHSAVLTEVAAFLPITQLSGSHVSFCCHSHREKKAHYTALKNKYLLGLCRFSSQFASYEALTWFPLREVVLNYYSCRLAK